MSVQDRINGYWTGRAPAYDDYQQRPERVAADTAAWSRVWSQALPVAPADVLDVGTGSGQVAMVLAGLGHRVTGIDLADGMLDRARAHAATVDNPPDIRRGDAVHPDFPPAGFDAVVSRYLMWTLREPRVALENWIRLLRPGGTIAVVDSTWFPRGVDIYDDAVRAALPLAAATSIQQTVTVLEQAGLTEVTLTPLTTILDLDREYGVADNHDVQLQYLVKGHRGPAELT
ncbi:class I SAM-dependent methyltransferase [Actinoplanes sp. NPDC051494]|uniref:class I SAM-dependent methyltransferase n=1 Tax=Actinoplanes sp. NPDC051494 TaxID=3363907 RepID=UPI0037929B0C